MNVNYIVALSLRTMNVCTTFDAKTSCRCRDCSLKAKNDNLMFTGGTLAINHVGTNMML